MDLKQLLTTQVDLKKLITIGIEKINIKTLRILLLSAFILGILMLAWQCDDAFHAYVMAKHLVEGNGFVYHIGERASAATAPLWTLICAGAYFITGEMYLTTLILCIVFASLAGFVVLFRLCKTKSQLFFAFLAMTGSPVFMTFTTSGLENGFLYFLFTLFMKEYFDSENFNQAKLFKLGFIFTTVALTRMDAVLMLIPSICYTFLAKRKKVPFGKAVLIGAICLTPFFLWELFSLFYYGFLVPNTAYAKLGSTIPKILYFRKGLHFTINSLINDPTLILIPAFFVGSAIKFRITKFIFPAVGILLYWFYIIWIGGDFMLGRHFSVLFFLSLTSLLELISSENIKKTNPLLPKILRVALCSCLVYVYAIILSSYFPVNPKFVNKITGTSESYDIDIALVYFYSPSIDIFSKKHFFSYLCDNAAEYAKTAAANKWKGSLDTGWGITVFCNSDLYMTDEFALGDPFLSKMPLAKNRGWQHGDQWRIGHLYRAVPAGYRETILTGENMIKDKDLAQYYDVIHEMTSGELFSMKRMTTVIDWNLGKYDYLLENYKKTLK